MRSLITCLLAPLFLVVSSQARGEIVRWEVAQGGNGHYYLLMAEPMAWREAKELCEKLDGHLVTVTSPEENRFLYQAFAKDHVCWLGATDESKEGEWRWVTGEPFKYQNWFNNEPSNSGGTEHYLAIGNTSTVMEGGGSYFYRFGPRWNDHDEHGKYHGKQIAFPVCEWENATPTRQADAPRKKERTKQPPAIAYDEFDGKLGLDWKIFEPDPSHVSLTKKPGTLTITTQEGGIHRATTGAKNLPLVDNPVADGGDFTMTTCLESFKPEANWNQAGLLCFDDEDNYIKCVYETGNSTGGRQLELCAEIKGATKNSVLPFKSEVGRIWLRVTKRGKRYIASFSVDGTTFRKFGELPWGDGSPRRLGLIAKNGANSNAPELDASFDFFEVRRPLAVEITVDRYAVPEGGVEELLGFIQDLKRFRPRSSQEYRAHRQKVTPALKLAAEKILKLEKDRSSEAFQAAQLVLLEHRVRTIRSASLADKKKLIKELEATLTKKAETKLTSSDRSLAMSAARALEYGNERELAAEAYESFARVIGGSPDEKIAKAAKMFEGAARRLRLLGNELELKGTRLDGGDFDWSAYRGKVVLVDFWATWCGPCVAEIPNVKKYYDLYHDRGFDVVGISLDRTRKSLTDFLDKEELPWITLYEEDASGSHPMATHYGVMAIPTVLLVDKEGKVVSLRARGAELGKLLNDLLGPIEEEEPRTFDQEAQDSTPDRTSTKTKTPASLTPAQQIVRAATKGDAVKVKILLRANPELLNTREGKRAYQSTPLAFAASNGRTDVVRVLLDHGAGVDFANSRGLTPLHDAAGQGHKEIVALLLANGADPKIKDRQRRTPLQLADEGGHHEVVKLLREHGADE